MEAMLGRGGRSSEGFFQERLSYPFSAAHIPERDRNPPLRLQHFGEKSQTHADDFAVLRKISDGLIEKGVLFPGKVAGPQWQATIGGP